MSLHRDVQRMEDALSSYHVEEGGRYRHRSLVSTIFNTHEPVKGKKQDKPLLIYLGGATGVGKTVLANLHSKEEGICYDVLDLAKEAGSELDLNTLKKELNLALNERVYVFSIPKFTTRDPRDSEVNGVDSYFVEPEVFKNLKSNLIFGYQYPEHGDGDQYGAPKSIRFPLNYGVDSVTTVTGYEAFSKMSKAFPNGVGILVDADARDIEAHIKGRAASEAEKVSRLSSFPNDRQNFYKHRHEIPYSVFIDSLKSLRVDVTPERERQVLQEFDYPLRLINAITRWERFLRKKGINETVTPQKNFDYFLDESSKTVFNGIEYGELKDRLKGESVPVIDIKKDAELLERYSSDKGISKSLLEGIVRSIKVNAVIDANGRRTIVLSPYAMNYIPTVGGTEKKVIVELLSKKLNGFGAHLTNETPREYKTVSLLSLLNFSYGVDEALFVNLSSDHVPVRELERPRALNIVFSNASDVSHAQSSIVELGLDDLVRINVALGYNETESNIFRRATQP